MLFDLLLYWWVWCGDCLLTLILVAFIVGRVFVLLFWWWARSLALVVACFCSAYGDFVLFA